MVAALPVARPPLLYWDPLPPSPGSAWRPPSPLPLAPLFIEGLSQWLYFRERLLARRGLGLPEADCCQRRVEPSLHQGVLE